MPSSRDHLDSAAPSSQKSLGRVARFVLLSILVAAWESPAEAQQQPQGFAVERLYQAAPGAGWVVMDDLTMHGGLGGVMAMSVGYAHNPLQVATRDGSQRLTLVSDQAFTDFGFAITRGPWRFYLNLDAPLAITGQSGNVGAYQLTAPSVDPGSRPDTLSDARIGVDTRLLGDAKSSFRLGVGAQLIAPTGDRADYDTDGTFRAMLRILFAGDVGSRLTYAGQLGIHVRPLDDSPAPGSPQGSELLFGLAGGPKIALDRSSKTIVVVGPELYGETAFSSFMGTTTTGLEGLLTGRVEGTADDGVQFRVKLGAGGGIDPNFGAPEWRMVFGLEVFDHSNDRDDDHLSDGKDACADTPGVTGNEPKIKGCPRQP